VSEQLKLIKRLLVEILGVNQSVIDGMFEVYSSNPNGALGGAFSYLRDVAVAKKVDELNALMKGVLLGSMLIDHFHHSDFQAAFKEILDAYSHNHSETGGANVFDFQKFKDAMKEKPLQ
jgi:hypothetical protein